MALPGVQIPQIETGLARLNQDHTFVVREQPFSALYIPEDKPIELGLKGTRRILRAGEVALFPKGDAHWLKLAGEKSGREEALNPPFQTSKDASGKGFFVFCARVPTAHNPMPDIVPSMLVLDKARQRSAYRLDDALKLLRYHALADRPDRQPIVRRMAEVCALTMLEIVLEDYRQKGLDLDGASKDPKIRKVINAIHRDPAFSWDVSALADQAGLSRSRLLDRFRQATGNSPLAYITEVRIAMAEGLLREEELPISEIAFRAGYDSDSAFAKAFRRQRGKTPSAFRKALRETR